MFNNDFFSSAWTLLLFMNISLIFINLNYTFRLLRSSNIKSSWIYVFVHIRINDFNGIKLISCFLTNIFDVPFVFYKSSDKSDCKLVAPPCVSDFVKSRSDVIKNLTLTGFSVCEIRIDQGGVNHRINNR